MLHSCFFARMLRACALTIVFFTFSVAFAQQVAPTEALSPAEEQKKFHLPPGFEIQLVASEPQIHKPINLNFDSAGRLYVTDTVEYPFPAADADKARDTVKVLVDRNGDGKADEVTTLVDKLNIPLGLQPIPGGVIVFGIPSIFRCLDLDGDGYAEKRETIYSKFASDDTHGMTNSFTRGLDGWIYATHGFRNSSTVKGGDGESITMNSGNTFRMRADGSHLEYFTHGQVNPFGLTFDPLGNLYSADCHTLPIYQLLRGAYYPSFGKADDGLGFGPTMIKHNHGSTGIGGIAYYAAEQFPPEYRDTVFIGNPVTGRVNHDRFAAHGSSFEAIEQPDFIRCDDPWFRPVSIALGPDGALYIADFYNRIIGHYEVPLGHPGRDRERGRIWRVVYTGKGAGKSESPNVAQASLEQLFELLSHNNFTVRTLATQEIVDRFGEQAAEPLRALLNADKTTAWQRIHGLWALERLEPIAPLLVEKLANDTNRGVRVHLIKALAERQEWPNSPIETLVRGKLQDSDAFVQRAAADALGRHPRVDNVRPLVDLWNRAPQDDTHLVHVVRMALRQHLIQTGMYAAIESAGSLDAKVAGKLGNISLGVPTVESAAFVWKQIKSEPAKVQGTYLHHVARYIPKSELGELFKILDNYQSHAPEQQLSAMKSVGLGLQERGEPAPPSLTSWSERLVGELLRAPREDQVKAGVELARDMKAKAAFAELVAIAGPQSRFGALRQGAIDACVAANGTGSLDLLGGIMASGNEPLPLRQHAALTLSKMNNDAAREILAKQLPFAPQKLGVVIAQGLADNTAGAERLLATIEAGKASATLLQETSIEQRIRSRNLKNIDERLKHLTAGLPPRDERFKELVERSRKTFVQAQPNVQVGAQLFKKSCANCHRIGDEGAKVGPNLDGVGIRGVDRLLEDLLDPNRNVDGAFRTTRIVTTDGKIVSGLVLREEGQILVLADAQGKEVRVPASEIEERSISPLSLMPANVSDQIPETELPHLLGYLLSQRQPANKP